MSASELVRTRDFVSFKSKPRNIFLTHKDRTHEQSRRYFSKCSIATECKRPSLKKAPAVVTSPCYLTIASPPSYLPLKSCPLIERYIPPSLVCHHESVSLKFQGMLRSPCSSPHSVLCSRFIKKPPSRKIYQKCSSSLKCLRSLKSSALSFPTSSCSRLLSQNVCKGFPKSGKNKPRKIFTHRSSGYVISPRRIHRRGFHTSVFPLFKSKPDKLPACEKIDDICKLNEKTVQCGQPCKGRSDVCRREKVKCDKQRDKTEKKIAELACKKTCLGRGKCELPRTVPPPKMEYAKVTCPPPKFAKPNPCPPIPERFQKDDGPRIKTRQINGQKKQICVPPLPKPPYGPMILCPCPPPRKLHPGPCPCYKEKGVIQPTPLRKTLPCPLKKKYPCPTEVHYCPPQKKPCNLKRDDKCEHKKKKKMAF